MDKDFLSSPKQSCSEDEYNNDIYARIDDDHVPCNTINQFKKSCKEERKCEVLKSEEGKKTPSNTTLDSLMGRVHRIISLKYEQDQSESIHLKDNFCNDNNNGSPQNNLQEDNAVRTMNYSSSKNTPKSLFALAGMKTPTMEKKHANLYSLFNQDLIKPEAQICEWEEATDKLNRVDTDDTLKSEILKQLESEEEEEKDNEVKEINPLLTPKDAPRLENEEGCQVKLLQQGMTNRTNKNDHKTKKSENIKMRVQDSISDVCSPQPHFQSSNHIHKSYQCRFKSTDVSLASQSLMHSFADFASEAISTSPPSMPEEMTAHVVGRQTVGSDVDEDGFGMLPSPPLYYCLGNINELKGDYFKKDQKDFENVNEEEVVRMDDIPMQFRLNSILKSTTDKNKEGKSFISKKNPISSKKLKIKTQSGNKKNPSKTDNKEIKLVSPDISCCQEYVIATSISPRKKSFRNKKTELQNVTVEEKNILIDEIDEIVCDNNPSDNPPIKLLGPQVTSKFADFNLEKNNHGDEKTIGWNEFSSEEIQMYEDTLTKTGKSVVMAIDEKLKDVKRYLCHTQDSSTTRVAKREIRRIEEVLKKMRVLSNELKSP